MHSTILESSRHKLHLIFDQFKTRNVEQKFFLQLDAAHPAVRSMTDRQTVANSQEAQMFLMNSTGITHLNPYLHLQSSN